MSGNVGIEEPPWVWGPSEGAKWAGASNASGKKRKVKRFRASARKETLPNPRIQIALSSGKKIISKGLGKKCLEEFDMGKVAEVIVRALHKAKITTLSRLRADAVAGHTLLRDTDNLTEVLDAFEKHREEVSQSMFLSLHINGRVTRDIQGKVVVRKVHGKNDYPIELIFKGEIARVRISQVINYIKRHLDVEKVVTNW